MCYDCGAFVIAKSRSHKEEVCAFKDSDFEKESLDSDTSSGYVSEDFDLDVLDSSSADQPVDITSLKDVQRTYVPPTGRGAFAHINELQLSGRRLVLPKEAGDTASKGIAHAASNFGGCVLETDLPESNADSLHSWMVGESSNQSFLGSGLIADVIPFVEDESLTQLMQRSGPLLDIDSDASRGSFTTSLS